MPGGLYLQVLTGTMGVDRPVDSTQLWYPAPVPVPVRVPGVYKIMNSGRGYKIRVPGVYKIMIPEVGYKIRVPGVYKIMIPGVG